MRIEHTNTIDWDDDFQIQPVTTPLARKVITNCPQLTKNGFHTERLDPSRYQEIYQRTMQAYYLQNNVVIEESRHDAINNPHLKHKPEICYLSDDYFTKLHTDPDFVKIHEEFAGCRLKPTYWYGPRVYHTGDVLREHIDHPTTHLIGSSIHIFTEGDSPWPLVFRSDTGFTKVFTEPGEITFFEAIRFPHSRPYRFLGKRHFGVFFHYFPVDDALFSETYKAASKEYEQIM